MQPRENSRDAQRKRDYNGINSAIKEYLQHMASQAAQPDTAPETLMAYKRILETFEIEEKKRTGSTVQGRYASH